MTSDGLRRDAGKTTRLVTWQISPNITALVSYPRWGGLAWVLGATHTGQVYELLLRRALDLPGQAPR